LPSSAIVILCTVVGYVPPPPVKNDNPLLAAIARPPLCPPPKIAAKSETPSGLLKVIADVKLPKVECEASFIIIFLLVLVVNLPVPFTSNLCPGLVVPIPTFDTLSNI
jgi:hypothetical protein